MKKIIVEWRKHPTMLIDTMYIVTDTKSTSVDLNELSSEDKKAIKTTIEKFFNE